MRECRERGLNAGVWGGRGAGRGDTPVQADACAPGEGREMDQHARSTPHASERACEGGAREGYERKSARCTRRGMPYGERKRKGAKGEQGTWQRENKGRVGKSE